MICAGGTLGASSLPPLACCGETIRGMGVGLTTAAVLATQMDMKLGVHSADHTTTFWLSVPAV